MLHRRRPAAALRRLVEGALAFTLGLALTGVAFAQNVTPEVTFLHRNATGDVVARTDASGAVVWRADVLPFSRLILDPANVEAPARYLGQNREQEIGPEGGLYRLGARMYAPFNGSFISPDPLSLAQIDLTDPQRFNKYSYGLNNPYRYADSSGLYVETLWDAANVAQGVASIAAWDANTSVFDKFLDFGGLGLDSLAMAIPIIPGGAGTALKAFRAAKKAASAVKRYSASTKIGKSVTKLKAARQEYVSQARSIRRFSKLMVEYGADAENMARWAVDSRNALKVSAREGLPKVLKWAAEKRNIRKYGNPVGLGADSLLKLKTPLQAIESSGSTNKIINRIFGVK